MRTENPLSAAGNWKVTLSTPVGPQVIQLRIALDGARFSGRIDGPMGSHDIAGEVGGNTLAWVMQVNKPVPVKVSFSVTVDGDSLSGYAKAGIFGKAPLHGERIAADTVAAPAEAGPVTADSVDPQFNEPYIEIEEERTEPAPQIGRAHV